jgi:hypothetical protein
MADSQQLPQDDMQGMSDVMADVYEAIATLEHGGREASRTSVATATGLPADVLDNALAVMTRRGLLNVRDESSGPVFVPARRGWSANPDEPRGQRLGRFG